MGITTPPTDRDASREAWPRGMPSVGDIASRSRRVAPEDIELFTAISGDRNPLHYDAELAARTRFGGIVVQGGVITAILNAVVAEDLPGPGSVFMQTDWTFRAPVRPDLCTTGGVLHGGALMALARYLLDGVISRRLSGFPWGTFVVNVSGALALLLAVKKMGPKEVRERLIKSVDRIGSSAFSAEFGHGRLNVHKLLR